MAEEEAPGATRPVPDWSLLVPGADKLATKDFRTARKTVAEICPAYFRAHYLIYHQNPDRVFQSFIDRFDRCAEIEELVTHDELTVGAVREALVHMIHCFHDPSIEVDSLAVDPKSQPPIEPPKILSFEDLKSAGKHLKAAEKILRKHDGWEDVADSVHEIIDKVLCFEVPKGKPPEPGMWLAGLLDDLLGLLEPRPRRRMIAGIVSAFAEPVDWHVLDQRLDKRQRRSERLRASY